jgi:hypothetical protein
MIGSYQFLERSYKMTCSIVILEENKHEVRGGSASGAAWAIAPVAAQLL